MNWWDSILMWVLGPSIGAVVGGFGTWFFSRRLQHNEELKSANDTFNAITETLEARIAKLLQQQTENQIRIEELTKRVEILSEEIEMLRTQIKDKEKLQKKVTTYEKLLSANNIAF